MASDGKLGASRQLTLKRLPQPPYGTHPAYGGAFPRPSVAVRARALAKLVPWIGLVFAKRVVLFDRLPVRPDYRPMKGGIGKRIVCGGAFIPLITKVLAEEAKKKLVGSDGPGPASDASGALLETLRRDGIAVTLAPESDIETIRTHIEGPLAQLLERREQSGQRTFEGNQTWLNAQESPELYTLLEHVLTRNGVLSAASAYLERPVRIRHILLQVNDARDGYQHNKFADVDVPDPATNYMHIDTTQEILKCMIYPEQVTDRTGPFCYVLGSSRLRVGWFENIVRRANDRAGLSGYQPEIREMFTALPPALRKKCTFGTDLLEGSPEVESLVGNEYRFTTADGNVGLFNNLGVHRGALVLEGERKVLILNLA